MQALRIPVQGRGACKTAMSRFKVSGHGPAGVAKTT